MCIYVPRAPRPAEAPEVMERLHGVQALFEGGGAGKGRRLRMKPGVRPEVRPEALCTGAVQEGRSPVREGASPGKRACRKVRAALPGRKKRAGCRGGRKASALRRKLAPACLVCVDITILVAVLCALYAPESLPAQLLSSFAAGR